MRTCAGSRPCVAGVVLCRCSTVLPFPAEMPMARTSFSSTDLLAIPPPYPYVSQLVSFGIVSLRDFEIHHTSTFFTVKVKPVSSIVCFLYTHKLCLKKLLPPQFPETENGASCIRPKNNHLRAPVGKEQLCGKINKHHQLLPKS